jgi:hypothetical protein
LKEKGDLKEEKDSTKKEDPIQPIKVNSAMNYVNLAQITDVFRAVVPVVLCRISTRTLMQEGHRYNLE